MNKEPHQSRGALGSILLLTLGFTLGIVTCLGFNRQRTTGHTPVQTGQSEEQASATEAAGSVESESTQADRAGAKEQIGHGILGIHGIWQQRNRVGAIDKLAAEISLDQIPEAVAEARLLQDDLERGRFLMALIVRLGKVNPLSAMACADGLEGKVVDADGDPVPKEAYKLAVLENWAKSDLEGAVSWVCSQPGGGFKGSALEKILPALTLQDPQRALALLLKNISPTEDRTYAQMFRQWALVDPVRAIQQLNQMGESFSSRNEVLESILSAWSAKDPDVALRYAKALPVGEVRNRALETCVLQMAERDPSAALNLSQSFPQGTWRDGLTVQMFSTWAANDSEAALAACSQLPDGLIKEKALQQVMRARISAAPASSAEYVGNLPPGQYRQELVTELGREWAFRDSGRALAWAQALPSGQERVAAMQNVISSWAYTAPQIAMEYALQDPALSKDVFLDIADKWAGKDFQAALQWSEAMQPGPAKDMALMALIERASWSDPQTAARLCSGLTREQPTGETITAIAESMSSYSVSDAVAWACGLQNEEARATALDKIAGRWSLSDPKGMADYALKMPDGENRQMYMQAACTELAARNFPDALNTVGQLPEGDLRWQLMQTLGESIATRGLDESAQAMASMSSGSDQQAAIQGLVSTWSNTDPQAAADWLLSFPTDNPQSEQLQTVIKKWAAAEPAEVGKWLTSLAMGVPEGAVTAFFEGAVEVQPEYAAQWTQSVTDETQRQKCQIQVAQHWMRTDPEAAKKWIGSLSLPKKLAQTPSP